MEGRQCNLYRFYIGSLDFWLPFHQGKLHGNIECKNKTTSAEKRKSLTAAASRGKV
jgi:hypothetical protein